MFQRDLQTKKSSIIRKSDRKKLLAAVRQSMPDVAAGVLESAESDIELAVCVLTNESEQKCNLYMMDGVPLFFAFGGHADDMDPLFPTVMTLARLPQLSASSFPIFPTHRFVVVEKLMAKTAADFMMPGLAGAIGGRATWKQDDIVLIAVGGVAMCVARALMSSDEVNAKLARNERSGKLARVIHCYRDNLYAMSNMKDRDKFEFALNAPISTSSSSTSTTSNSTTTTLSLSSSNSEITNDNNNNNSSSSSVVVLTTEEYEKNLDDAFFAALTATKNDELPLLVSTFNARLLANRSEQIVIDIKKTHWKRLQPFMQQKEADGVIKLCEPSSGVLSIESINRQHVDVRNARNIARALEPPPAPVGLNLRSLVDAATSLATSAALASSTSTLTTITSNNDTNSSSLSSSLSSSSSSILFPPSSSANSSTTSSIAVAVASNNDVERLFLPRISQLLLVPDAMQDLFNHQPMCTSQQADDVITQYIAESLTKVGKNTCNLNGKLMQLLPDVDATKPIAKKQLQTRMLALFQPCWTIVDPKKSISVAPKLHTDALPTIHVEETRIRNKNCTVVTNLSETFGVSLELVADRWRTRLACGVSESQHKSRDCVLIQGYRGSDVVQALCDDFGCTESMCQLVLAK